MILSRCIVGVLVFVSLMGVLLFPGVVQEAQAQSSGFLRVHPQSPFYLEYKGRPLLIVTSAEHYGAVINPDFDYRRYLDTIAADGLNMTRVFSGTYIEGDGFFQIPHNDPMSPNPATYLSPWKRSTTPGYNGGGNKLDLTQFDPAYFQRLKDFLRYAESKGIVVEFVFFCGAYDNNTLIKHSFYPQNNIQNKGYSTMHETDWYWTLNPKNIFRAEQEAVVRKIVQELRDHPNVYYEVMNEPWMFARQTVQPDDIYRWQSWVVDIIADEESAFANKHLIAEGRKATSTNFLVPNPRTSIVTFHYMYTDAYYSEGTWGNDQTEWDRWNKLRRIMVNDETGQAGTSERSYRQEAWETVVQGSHINNLDFSFKEDDETGRIRSFTFHGGGSPELRREYGILKRFVYGFDFWRMRPSDSLLVGGSDRNRRVRVRLFAEEGRQYLAAILNKGTQNLPSLTISMAAGEYDFVWLNTKTGAEIEKNRFTHGGGYKQFSVPTYSEDIVLGIRRTGQTYGIDPGNIGGVVSQPIACSLLNRSNVAFGFGAAYNLFSPSRELILNATCFTNKTEIEVGSKSSSQYIYKYGYVWKNLKREQVILHGQQSEYPDWIKGYATATIEHTPDELQNTLYFVADVCEKVGEGDYNCGCADATCARSFWQRQAIRSN